MRRTKQITTHRSFANSAKAEGAYGVSGGTLREWDEKRPSSSYVRGYSPEDKTLTPAGPNYGYQFGDGKSVHNGNAVEAGLWSSTGMLAHEMRQPFATPNFLKSTAEYLLEEIKNGFANLAALYMQSEQNTKKTRLYTREEIAERLGVGLTTLDSMRQDPDFPCIYLTDASSRGSVRFELDEVLSHLRRKNAIRREMAR